MTSSTVDVVPLPTPKLLSLIGWKPQPYLCCSNACLWIWSTHHLVRRQQPPTVATVVGSRHLAVSSRPLLITLEVESLIFLAVGTLSGWYPVRSPSGFHLYYRLLTLGDSLFRLLLPPPARSVAGDCDLLLWVVFNFLTSCTTLAQL